MRQSCPEQGPFGNRIVRNACQEQAIRSVVESDCLRHYSVLRSKEIVMEMIYFFTAEAQRTQRTGSM
jgi:hypothetical protein